MRELRDKKRLERLYAGRLQRVKAARVGVPAALRSSLKATTGDERFLTYDYPRGWPLSKREPSAFYDPLEEPELYTRFARLDFDDSAAVEAFFARYGPLRPGSRFQDLSGEPVGTVRRVAGRLRRLIELYHALRKSDKALDDAVTSSIVRVVRDVGGIFYVLREDVPVWIQGKQKLREAVQGAIPVTLAEELAGVRLYAAPEGSSGFRPQWGYDSLQQALFLQFYFDVTEHRRLRRCPECKSLFRLTRKNRDYCSDTCSSRKRQRAFYQEHRKKGRPAPIRSFGKAARLGP